VYSSWYGRRQLTVEIQPIYTQTSFLKTQQLI